MRTILMILLSLLSGCSFLKKEVPEFSGDKSFDYLKTQLSMGFRYPESEGHQKLVDFISKTITQNKLNLIKQPFTKNLDGKEVKFINLIGEYTPTKDKGILLAAHFDTRPFADRDPIEENRKKPVPGANDGASGVAVLLHLIELINQHKPARNVTFVFFDGEDYGRDSETMFNGSRYFAEKTELSKYEYGILIDMIGDANLNIYKEKNSVAFAPELVDKIWKRAESLNIKEFIDTEKHFISDDHIPLNEKGLPCVDLIDFDYTFWHTILDDIDGVSKDSLYKIGTLLINILFNSL